VAALSASGKEIVIASYNVENYLSTDRRVNGQAEKTAPKPESEIAALVDVLSEIRPDILGIIEMGDESMLEDFHARLKAAGMDFPHREWVKGADEHRHIALLSRFPIVARNSRDDVGFELNGVPTRIGRGILDVSVEPEPDFRLRLVGVHLKSRRQVPDFDESAMRAKEAWYVREHLDRIFEADPGAKVMLFGDLNDTKNQYPVRELIGSAKSPGYMRDLFLTDGVGQRWTHFWSAADVYSRIDYLLVSRGLWPAINMEKSGISRSRIWFKASDHRAVFATIKVPEE
jgi:endonuclease/exonuclease/phosphatase family metal-dependent hydrolase